MKFNTTYTKSRTILPLAFTSDLSQCEKRLIRCKESSTIIVSKLIYKNNNILSLTSVADGQFPITIHHSKKIP